MNLELYPLQVFCQVIQDQTFSAAAKSLRVSQPTVSQQIAKLESRLKARLFQRVGHDVVPTPQGKELYQFAFPLLEQVTSFEEKMAQGWSSPRGLVRYAMPESCQWTPHYRKIMAQTARFPEMQFKIGVLPSEKILQDLLEGELDFGFVVGDRVSPELRFEKFCEEFYSGVAASTELREGVRDPSSKKFRLVTFPGWEPFFTVWAKAHGYWARLKPWMAEPSVYIGTLAGAIHATQEGAGFAVLPSHCIIDELSSGQLLEHQVRGVKAASPVYIARRLGDKLTHRAELVIELLRKSKAGQLI